MPAIYSEVSPVWSGDGVDVSLGDGPLVWAHLMFRFGGLFLVAPVFSAAVVPVRIKAALTLLLTVLLFPPAFAARVPELLELGVALVGGCCGTTPEHIRALRHAVDGWKS